MKKQGLPAIRIEKTLHEFLDRHGIGSDERILVAFSGGSDSLAMLIALSRIHRAVTAFYVNHHIRNNAELENEIKLNTSNAEKLNIPLEIADVSRNEFETLAKKGGEEYAARVLRYRLLDEFAGKNKIKYIFTAHNRDDDDELDIIRFFRGGEPAESIPEKNGKLYRPFLCFTHKELEDYVKANGFEFSVDSTNFDCKNLRSQIRANLLPYIERVFPSFSSALLSARMIDRNGRETEKLLFDTFSIIGMNNSNNGRISRKDISSMADFIRKGNDTGSIEYANAVVFRQKSDVYIARGNAFSSPFSVSVSSQGFYALNPLCSLSVFESSLEKFDLSNLCSMPPDVIVLPAGDYIVRSAADGDSIMLDGKERNVKNFFKKNQVSSRIAASVPVIESKGSIAAVALGAAGLKNRISDNVKFDSGRIFVFVFSF